MASKREEIKALIDEVENMAERAANLGLGTVVFLLDMASLDAQQALDNASGPDEGSKKKKIRR